MREVKTDKYSKHWYGKRVNNIRNFCTISITLGLGFLIGCGMLLESGNSDLTVFLLYILIGTGFSSFIGLLLYATINAEIENNLDMMYKDFLFNIVFREREKQDKKMKKWLI